MIIDCISCFIYNVLYEKTKFNFNVSENNRRNSIKFGILQNLAYGDQQSRVWKL